MLTFPAITDPLRTQLFKPLSGFFQQSTELGPKNPEGYLGDVDKHGHKNLLCEGFRLEQGVDDFDYEDVDAGILIRFKNLGLS